MAATSASGRSLALALRWVGVAQMKYLFGVVLVLLVIPGRAAAADLEWRTLTSPQIQQPVEQETDYPYPASEDRWVRNPFTPAEAGPFGCPWDVDDQFAAYTSGRLSGGASVNFTACLVGSPRSYFRCLNGTCAWWSPFLSYFQSQVTTDVPLDVTLCYDTSPRCFTPAAVYDQDTRNYVYSTCTRESYRYHGLDDPSSDPALGVVAGSQGGVGVVEHVTLSVTNPNAHGNASVFAQLGEDATADGVTTGGCSDLYLNQFQGSKLPVSDYPYDYLVS